MGEDFVDLQASWVVGENERRLLNLKGPRPFGSLEPEEQELRDSVRAIRVGIQKYANCQKIPSRKIDESVREAGYEYYRVYTGMNINVPKGRIKELRFFLAVSGDGRQSRDVYVVDGFPNDKITHVSVVGGKIGLSLDSLLRFVPGPIGELTGTAVQLSVGPWEFDWGYDKLQVGFSEGNTDTVDWYLSSDNVNQSFVCYVTLKKKKTVSKVTGEAWAKWNYEPASREVLEWFKKRFGWGAIEPMSGRQSIAILGQG